MQAKQDAYGQEVHDYFHGQTDITEIVERDDGYIDTSSGPDAYFAPYAAWSPVEQEAIQLAAGRVLDVGCGPGRVLLHLQAQGLEAVGIDNSPLAVEVARARGAHDARVLSITRASRKTLGTFDTIVMFGNNFGLFGTAQRARWLLRRFDGMVRADGRILAITLNPYDTTNPDHLAYQAANRARGRMSGQVRIRIRHRRIVGGWFDYLFVSPEELAEIVAGAGWRVGRLLRQDGSPVYAAVLEKAA